MSRIGRTPDVTVSVFELVMATDLGRIPEWRGAVVETREYHAGGVEIVGQRHRSSAGEGLLIVRPSAAASSAAIDDISVCVKPGAIPRSCIAADGFHFHPAVSWATVHATPQKKHLPLGARAWEGSEALLAGLVRVAPVKSTALDCVLRSTLVWASSPVTPTAMTRTRCSLIYPYCKDHE